MEVREGQDNKTLGMPTILAFNNPQTRDHSSSSTTTSSKLSSSPSLLLHHHHHVNHTLIFNNPQTLEPFYQPQPNQSTPHKPSIAPNPNPIPIPNTIPNPNLSLSSTKDVRYRECLKNHAASSGRQVLDGCGEYMPSGEGLNCAACECHRNFHRKDIQGDDHHHTEKSGCRKNAQSRNVAPPQPSDQHHHHQHRQFATPSSPNVAALFPRGSMMDFGADQSSSEDLKHIDKMYENSNQGGSSRKRFRTKFSDEQKGKMMEVAERLGWRIKKGDEDEVEELRKELGVKIRVFKVWMHNSKQAIKKKQML